MRWHHRIIKRITDELMTINNNLNCSKTRWWYLNPLTPNTRYLNNQYYNLRYNHRYYTPDSVSVHWNHHDTIRPYREKFVSTPKTGFQTHLFLILLTAGLFFQT